MILFQIFSQALYTTLRKVLKEIASPEIAFAWRAFMFDATSKNILGLPAGSRPGNTFIWMFVQIFLFHKSASLCALSVSQLWHCLI